MSEVPHVFPRDMHPIFGAISIPVLGEPVPALPRVAMPDRLTSHDVILPTGDLPADTIIREVNARLIAEDQRLRRLLPPAPDGQRWAGEINASDHFDFDAYRAETHYRLRYRLVDTDQDAHTAPTDSTGRRLTMNARGEWVNEIGDTRCPNDGEFTNKRCWKCGWTRRQEGPEDVHE